MLRTKKLLFISLFLSCFIFSSPLNAQKLNQFDKNKKRTGVWKKFHTNKNIRYEGAFANGKEIGVFKFYDIRSSEFPIIVKSYFENSDSLTVQFYSIKGVLQSKGVMKQRNRIGKWTYFFPDGKIISEENYLKGKLEGKSVTYYNDGKVAEISFFKNGLKSGVNKKFSNLEILIEEVTFENGKENGLAKYFDLEGNLKEKGIYKDGRRIGEWDYYIDGELASDKQKKEERNSYKKEN